MPQNISKHSAFIVDCYEQVTKLETPYEFYSLLKEIATRLGFSNYVLLHVPEQNETHIRPAFIATNWPSELIREYDENKLLHNSPVIKELRESSQPIFCDVEEIPLNRPGGEKNLARDLFVRFNIPKGVYFPCYDGSGRKGAIAFMGERDLPQRGETAILHLLSHYAFGHIHLLLENQQTNSVLKPREIACLTLAAKGKTNADCAAALNVSETTIAGYFASIGRKLSAHNKTHMVAIAYEQGLLQAKRS